MGKFSFIIDSDLHFGKSLDENGNAIIFQRNKKNHIEKILKLIKENPDEIKAVICPGDLTEHGWNGALKCITKTPDELTPLKKEYVKPIEDVGVPVYLCVGNHDNTIPLPTPIDYIYLPVYNYVVAKHGSLEYDFVIENIHFICMSVYPKKSKMKYLKKKMTEAIDEDKKIIIYFHYNLEGPFSDWFKVDLKKDYDAFFETIKPYRDHILALIVGHLHLTYDSEHKPYNDDFKFRVISGAGYNAILCTYDDEIEKLETKQI